VKYAVRGVHRVRILAFLLLASCVQRDRIHRVVVSIADQAMDVYAQDQRVSHYLVSTSKFGMGDRSGTYRTPLGRLEVAKKIGAGAPLGAVFKSRKPTGEVLVPDAPGRDPIVTRILWLKGLEPQNADAFDRYIYIHGTPEERNIGRPASFGCVRMRSADIIRLFATVGVGARVEIIPGPLAEDMPTPTIAAGSLGSHTR
jgi:L,D-transpeptidase catalytic domain